jgi:NADH:ubiquinone reductase (H+-translocating)
LADHPHQSVSHHILPHHIVVVGGGAGGLVLATRLGDRLGRRGRARVSLIDCVLNHVWKPLLHEVAVGTMGPHNDDVNYLGHARDHHFRFQPGRMEGLDRRRREVLLAPILDGEGQEAIPARRIAYDTLVIAVGSTSNDFGIPGVAEHCLYLDSYQQADRFQQRLLGLCLQAQLRPYRTAGKVLRIAIVGAGATGVELSAEMHKALRHLSDYGLDRIDVARDVEISLIESAPRVLPNLPERLSKATEAELKRLGIRLYAGESVASVGATGITTRSGRFLPADIKVWAAGVKAADALADLDGLETNRINQLVVQATLQSTRDDDIFAIGDCAACPQPGKERPVPPRAQAAYQEAMLLARSLEGRLAGKPLRRFVYRDYGSLISLSYSSVGNIMGNLLGSVMLEGMIARLAYLSLYKKHQLALHGFLWVAFATLANLIKRRTEPRLKLH